MKLLTSIASRARAVFKPPPVTGTPVQKELRAARAASIERQRKRRVQSPVECDVWPERKAAKS